eukprot:356602-Chlamydomonas_euryale.AAC.10
MKHRHEHARTGNTFQRVIVCTPRNIRLIAWIWALEVVLSTTTSTLPGPGWHKNDKMIKLVLMWLTYVCIWARGAAWDCKRHSGLHTVRWGRMGLHVAVRAPYFLTFSLLPHTIHVTRDYAHEHAATCRDMQLQVDWIVMPVFLFQEKWHCPPHAYRGVFLIRNTPRGQHMMHLAYAEAVSKQHSWADQQALIQALHQSGRRSVFSKLVLRLPFTEMHLLQSYHVNKLLRLYTSGVQADMLPTSWAPSHWALHLVDSTWHERGQLLAALSFCSAPSTWNTHVSNVTLFCNFLLSANRAAGKFKCGTRGLQPSFRVRHTYFAPPPLVPSTAPSGRATAGHIDSFATSSVAEAILGTSH